MSSDRDEKWEGPAVAGSPVAPVSASDDLRSLMGLGPKIPPEAYWLHIGRHPFAFRIVNFLVWMSALLIDTVIWTIGLIAIQAIFWNPANTLFLTIAVFICLLLVHWMSAARSGFLSFFDLVYLGYRLPVKNAVALSASFGATLVAAKAGWASWAVWLVCIVAFTFVRKTTRLLFHLLFNHMFFGRVSPPRPRLRRNPRSLGRPLS
jgi:hypothetical protein